MTVDPRAALDRFVAALEAHFAAVANRRSDSDASVDDAYDVLADAFDVYDEALAVTHGEATPFYLADDEDGDDHDDDENDEDDDDEDDDDEDEDDDDEDEDEDAVVDAALLPAEGLADLSAQDFETLVDRNRNRA